MKQKLEGIVLSKVPHKERDILARLLLRNGKSISVYFYGAQGGGKKQKGSMLEIGHLISLTLNISQNKTDVYSVKEWKLKWHYEKLRNSFQSFNLLCFYIEIISKIAQKDDLIENHDDIDQSDVGLFRVLSNAIFYLEESIKSQTFSFYQHFNLFLGKLLMEQGVFPERMNCVLSGNDLTPSDQVVLLNEHGGFALSESVDQIDRNTIQNGKSAWLVLGEYFIQNILNIKKLLSLETIAQNSYLIISCINYI